jgi:putative spermidine/putrescine transport system substrate-binding protein
MRSSTVLAVAVAASLLTVSACSSTSTASSASPGSNSAAVSSGSSSAAVSAAGAPMSGCPSSAAADTFTFSSDGDVNVQNLWQQTLLPAFKKACPQFTVNFVFDIHSANANLNVSKIAAADKVGQAPPIDVADDSVAEAAAQAGLTQKITAAQVPAISEVNPAALARFDSAALPYRGSSVLLAYDSTKVANPPKTLKDLLAWIIANPGQFTYNDPSSGGSGGSFVETVLDSYVSAADLTKMQSGYTPALESQWAQGFTTLKGLTPSIYQKVYPNGNQAVLDLLGKGEISMAPVWSDQFLAAKGQGQLGAEYKVTQIADPSFTGGAAYLAIIKGSKHAAAGAAFIQWLLQPQQQGEIVKSIAGFPAISMTKLPTAEQTAFGGVDVQNLRPGVSSKMGADMQSQWAAKVPG